MNVRHPEREALVLPSRLLYSQEVCCKLQRGSISILISIFIGRRGIKWQVRTVFCRLSCGLTISNARKFVHHKLAGRGDQRRQNEFWVKCP